MRVINKGKNRTFLGKILRYIEIFFDIEKHYKEKRLWVFDKCSLYRDFRYIEVRYMEVQL